MFKTRRSIAALAIGCTLLLGACGAPSGPDLNGADAKACQADMILEATGQIQYTVTPAVCGQFTKTQLDAWYEETLASQSAK